MSSNGKPNPHWIAEDDAFHRDVRAFLDQAMTPDIRAVARRQAGVSAEGHLAKRWHRILYQKGWIAPGWPREYGGTGWTPIQRFIFTDECAKANAPKLPGFGLQMCGPVLMRFGTAEQKAFFLPRILSGEHYWCQGYSEPQAGSDLASLRTAAVADGDHYVVNGSKMWTTHAQYANWIMLLVRTAPTGKDGISFLLVPLDTQGITIRPIISISGEHEVNQVFFDDVRVPIKNRVGAENGGWSVAKYLLEFERGGGLKSSALRFMLHRAKIIADAQGGDEGGDFWNDQPNFRRRWCEVDIDLQALEFAEREAVTALSSHRDIGDTVASRMKLSASTLLQRISELAIEALGPYAAADQRAALNDPNAAPVGPDYAAVPMAHYLNSRAATIYGGAQEIQRNILARELLKR